MEDKITLDKNAFKALASETRVSLLKKLGSRRATPSELAASLGISAQAASEHLDKLASAGLVRREDEGRKWVYYSLTEKGRALVRPDEKKKIWVLLSVAVVLLAFGFFSLFAYSGSIGYASSAAPASLERVAQAVETPAPAAFGQDALKERSGAYAVSAAQSQSLTPSPIAAAAANYGLGADGFVAVVALAGGLVLLAAALAYYWKSKRQRN